MGTAEISASSLPTHHSRFKCRNFSGHGRVPGHNYKKWQGNFPDLGPLCEGRDGIESPSGKETLRGDFCLGQTKHSSINQEPLEPISHFGNNSVASVLPSFCYN